MAPRRGGGSHGGGSGSGSGSGLGCTGCDTPMSAQFFALYDTGSLYGMLVVNALLAAALLLPLYLNRRPLAKTALLATLLFFGGCVFQCVRWGLVVPDNWVPHGYRFEGSVIVLLQRLGWPTLLAALLLAMRPGKILGAAAGSGVLLLAALNIAYLVLDFVISDGAVKDWLAGDSLGGSPWRLGDRDFGVLWTRRMVKRFTDQPGYAAYPTTWSRDQATMYRAWLLYVPPGSAAYRNRDAQIKVGIAADVVALLVVLALGGLHVVTWHRQGKAELPRRRSFLAVAVAGLLLSATFRVVVSARWILHNWHVITDEQLWADWLAYFPDTNTMADWVRMPATWLPGYRTTVEAFPVLQVVLEQIGPVVACVLIVLSMAAERRRARELRHQQVGGMKMQGHYN
ncbi:hypothetical protein ISF_06399 [Cordyceps fumosorosea ARSEF 2679]|uniref:Uncharacterized protein n=1 Tax=Cordyceps fumosorosea (strain ARSEF 2679) TaxID=1081104 RepID=A0A167SBV2_CORFA|nr:hypothetical protein ISF_06399 [Cordyceps fumosorosea ARSEF 2679]OAA59464.1 hypothetical protein ISF_06399 [Cordyceps fumosorosea ARSEF 2679]